MMRCVLLTALDIAEALRFMHRTNVLHGDLKPHNILLVKDLSVRPPHLSLDPAGGCSAAGSPPPDALLPRPAAGASTPLHVVCVATRQGDDAAALHTCCELLELSCRYPAACAAVWDPVLPFHTANPCID